MENVPAMSGINESAAALKNGVKTTAVDITEGVLSTSINEMDDKKDGAAAAALNNVESAEALKDKNVHVPLINKKSAALQKNYIMLHYVMQYYIKKNYIMLHIMQHIILHITSKDFIYIVSDDTEIEKVKRHGLLLAAPGRDGEPQFFFLSASPPWSTTADAEAHTAWGRATGATRSFATRRRRPSERRT